MSSESLKFDIIQTSSSSTLRPPISYLVRDYLKEFFFEKLIEPKRLIIGGKWKIIVCLHFIEEGIRFKSSKIIITKSPRIIVSENTKLYEIIIPLKKLDGANDLYLKTVEVMYEALSLFFSSTYKKADADYLRGLWEQIDITYLKSLPYPAAKADQRYVGDINI